MEKDKGTAAATGGENTQDNAAATQGAAGGETPTGTAKKETAKKPAAKKAAPKKTATKTQDAGDGEGSTTSPAVETGNAALKKIGREALKRNPSMRAVYVTSDGTAFGSSNDAENHAKTLGNSTVEIVTE